MPKYTDIIASRNYLDLHIAPSGESVSFCGNEQPPRGSQRSRGWWSAGYCARIEYGDVALYIPHGMTLCFDCLVKWKAR